MELVYKAIKTIAINSIFYICREKHEYVKERNGRYKSRFTLNL